MGSMHAEEYASMKGKNKDMGLLAHLQGNHYPPVPASMLGPSKRAISAVNKGKHDSNIKLPHGILYKGKKSAPASAIVEAHHLHSWLNPDQFQD
jgi:hypothetical protein